MKCARESLIGRVPVSSVGRKDYLWSPIPLDSSATELSARPPGNGRYMASKCPFGGASYSQQVYLIRQRHGNATEHGSEKARRPCLLFCFRKVFIVLWGTSGTVHV